MTFYQRICAINFPTVVLLLLTAGAILMLGAFGLFWLDISPFWSLLTAYFGFLTLWFPFAFEPWSKPS